MGFATLPNQVHRKSVKKGFDFTLMVAGKSSFAHEQTFDLKPTFYYEETSQNLKPRSFRLCCSLFEGESGLGKSTLVNSLFLTDLYKDRKLLNAEGEVLIYFFVF